MQEEMKEAAGGERQWEILQDVMRGQHDLQTLARTHGMNMRELAAWVNEPGHERTLAGLCKLADYQTQLLLSQYRRFALTRLIELASGQGEAMSEASRRACVDLLKIDLRRASPTENKGQEEEGQAKTEALILKGLGQVYDSAGGGEGEE